MDVYMGPLRVDVIVYISRRRHQKMEAAGTDGPRDDPPTAGMR